MRSEGLSHLTTPVWVLLGFAIWTLLSLVATVGVYRWARILTGRSEIRAFRADDVQGSDFYKRAMRAHANCVENLPVYAAIVVVITAGGFDAPVLDVLSVVLLGARVLQTLVHTALEQTNLVASIRFAFFFVQLLSMLSMTAYLIAV
jgi:uncharacterized MAPEG superfamily protein